MASTESEVNDVKAPPRDSLTSDHVPPVATDLTAPAICVICLERIADEVILIPCRHDQFHFICVGTWLQHNKICPLCKAEVKSVNYREKGVLVSYNLPETVQKSSSLHHAARLPNRRRGVRRRLENEPSQPEELQEPALAFRRQVYHDRLFSMYVGNNKYSGYRNLTPQLIRGDQGLVLKAKKWIRRELRAFDFLNPGSSSFGRVDRRATNAEYLLEYILAILKSIDLKGSAGQAQELLSDYLGRENACLFLHELEAWLRSPYDTLKDWDDSMQYAKR